MLFLGLNYVAMYNNIPVNIRIGSAIVGSSCLASNWLEKKDKVE